ncbi:sensor histidine kinase [Aquimarina longa]|uniref:sensor histidine kinase n=1 Tax=Aquimarina longa TaxID=1080221 RepID=UPI0007863FC0|nr:histidine kinase [Aquimarina longa]
MSNLINTYRFLYTPFFKHILFWIAIFSYFIITANISFYSGYKQLFESNGILISLQILTAYIVMYVLVPRFLNKNKIVQFIFWLFILLVMMYALYNFIKIYYYDPKYVAFYSLTAKEYAKKSLLTKCLNFPIFLSKSIKFITPTALLMMARFYKNQQKLLKLNEQKKSAELIALKHQLNPHFLFNTLNNLYALALKKSDQTPEVIEKLSDILDYMLYRCNDKFVSLPKEIELIENYIVLEKIRYGKRVEISFEKNITKEVKIGPLLLLTFIENAFKHGVSQELGKAYISIRIDSNEDHIVFNIKNSKTQTISNENKECIGLKNIKKQLELLYMDQHDLVIEDKKDSYSIILKLKAI